MIRSYAAGLAAAFFLFVFPVFNFVSAADFSGIWSGPYLTSPNAYGTPSYLTVSITQTGDAISGTFTASGGDTGSFSGQAAGDRFFADMESPAGPFTMKGTFAATLLNDVLVWEGIGYLFDAVGMAGGALAKNWMAGTGHWLNISKYNFPSGDTKADVWASVSVPEGTSVTLVTPSLNRIPINEWDSEDNSYDGGYWFDVTNIDTACPNGVYSFSMVFDDGSKGACFTTITGEFSDQVPEITEPLPDIEIPETDPLTVKWNPWQNPDAFGDVTVYFDIDHFVSLPKSTTSYAVPANTLPDDYLDTFKVGFGRPSGYYGGKSVNSRSYIRTSSHKVQDYWMGKVKLQLPSGSMAGGLFVGMDASGVSAAVLLPPAGASGGTIALAQGAEQVEEWHGGIRSQTFAGLESSYPDGTYGLRIDYTDGSQETKTIQMTGDYPGAVPDISLPAHLSHLNWWEGFTMGWAAWPQFGVADHFIVANVTTMGTATEAGYLSSEEVWSKSDGNEADGTRIPGGVLKSGKNYALELVFVKELAQGAMKATGNVVFVETTVQPASTLAAGSTGDGTGRIVSHDGRIDCSTAGSGCRADYDQNQQVVLIAVPDPGSQFSGWSGDSDCLDGVVDLEQDQNCIAQFSPSDCPFCSGDVVTLQGATFLAGTECSCIATVSLNTGTEITIEKDAIVNFIAPEIQLGAGIHINEGASFTTSTQ